MNHSLDDLTDEQIGEAASKLRAPRSTWSRISLALKRWLRDGHKVRMFRFRQDQALKFEEYECRGGPLDGKVRKCQPYAVYPVDRGYYEIDRKDCLLHYRMGARVSSWRGE